MTTTPLEPDLRDPAIVTDPYASFAAFREEAPVLRGLAMDGSPAWYVTRQADVRTVLSDPRFVNSSRSVPGEQVDSIRDRMIEQLGVPAEYVPYVADSILDKDGFDHVRLRKLVSRAFTVKRVNGLRPRVEEITNGLLDALAAAGQQVDLVESFAYPLPITVISELVGVPEEARQRWHTWGNEIVSMRPELLAPAVRAMVDHTRELIAAKRAEPADDLLSALIEIQDEGDRLSDDELITMVVTLVFAGHETTAHLISNGIRALAEHPDQLELLRRDPGLWPTAVHELMRWCGPVLITRLRYAAEDIELGGVQMRAGDAVQAVLVSANFDPREYAEPERLDVTRRPAGRGEGHVGFGHGMHYCLGAALARQEGEVALRMLFERFPELRLDGPPEWAPIPSMRRHTRLPATLGS